MMKLYAFVCEGTPDEIQDFAQRILPTDTGCQRRSEDAREWPG